MWLDLIHSLIKKKTSSGIWKIKSITRNEYKNKINELRKKYFSFLHTEIFYQPLQFPCIYAIT